jgi:hypothetical protein
MEKRKKEREAGHEAERRSKMLRITNIGGDSVGMGNYWNFATGNRVHIEEAGILPGDRTQRYYKAHPAAILIAAPVLGLAYAVFLPFIGLAMLASVLLKKLFGGLAASAYRGAAFSWQPSEAYLAGKRRSARKSENWEEKKE